MTAGDSPNRTGKSEGARARWPPTRSPWRTATGLIAVLAVGIATFLVTSSGARTASHVRARNADARFSANVASNAAASQYNTTNGNGSSGNPGSGSNPGSGGDPGSGNQVGGGDRPSPAAAATPAPGSNPGAGSTPGSGSTPGDAI